MAGQMDRYLSGEQREWGQADERTNDTRHKYLKSLLVEAAWAATRTKGTYLRTKYDSMVGRKGKKKALLILGHKILNAAYIILITRLSYQAYSVEEFEKRRSQKRITYLQTELKGLGVMV